MLEKLQHPRDLVSRSPEFAGRPVDQLDWKPWGALGICIERDVILDGSDYKSRAYGRLTNAGSLSYNSKRYNYQERRRGNWPDEAPGNLVKPPRCQFQPGNGDDRAYA